MRNAFLAILFVLLLPSLSAANAAETILITYSDTIERVVFDGIYKKMERELHEKKKQMAEIIESSNDAYEERDTDQNELSALKSQAEKEMAVYEEKFLELERILDQDRQAKEFIKLKERERKDREILGDLVIDDEAALKKKNTKGNLAEQKAKQASIHDKVQSYEEAFEKIKVATGVKDLDELVTNFINAEDANLIFSKASS